MNTIKSSPFKTNLLAVVACSMLFTAGASAAPMVNAPASVTTISDTSTATADNSEQHHWKKGHRKGKRGPEHRMRMIFKTLNLTDEQQAQVKDKIKTFRDENKSQRQASKANLLEVLTAANFDENKAQQIITARKDKRQQRMIDSLKLQNDIYNTVLTADQQQMFMEKFNQRGGKRDSTSQ